MQKLKFIWPDKSTITKGAFRAVKILRAKGFATYVAGGAVRDALLARPIIEIDIATEALPAQVKKLFKKSIPTGEKHGTITVRSGNSHYEITTFRKESIYENVRRPKNVKFISDPETDAKRRDVTINAMFFDPETREIVDYADGIEDLRRRRIRLVGDPDDRITEDALRMLRAVRLSTILNFEIEKETRRAIARHAKLIRKISAERVKQELDKMIMAERASAGIGLLDTVGLLQQILPELKSCQNVTQPKNLHREGDVYTHSILALEQVNEEFDLPTRYAVLFHDLGKVKTRELRKNKITFYNHQNVGAELVLRICRRLKFSRADEDKISWLVRSHLVPNDFRAMRLGTRRKWGLSPHFADLLRVYWADASATLNPAGRGDSNPVGYRVGQKILTEIKNTPQLAKPILSGTDVMRVMKIKPGPLVGKILKTIEEKKLENKLKTKKDALGYLKLNKNKLLKQK